MKRVVAICLISLLSSCASTDTKSPAKLATTGEGKSGLDEIYMRKVESQAIQRGVVVKWVHPPKAPKVKKDGQ